MGILIPSFRDFTSWRSTEKQDLYPKAQERDIELISELLELGELNTTNWPKIDEYSFMSKYIPGIKFHSSGGLCPFQSDGIWGNYEFYYRERGGVAQLRLAPIGTFPSFNKSHWQASVNVEEFREGIGWINTFLNLWKNLEPTQRSWGFPAFGWTRNEDNERVRSNTKNSNIEAPGNTVEEAFKNLFINGYEDAADYDVKIEEGYIINDGSLNVTNPSQALTISQEFVKVIEVVEIPESTA